MHALTPKVIPILRKYMREPFAPVTNAMALRALDIDDLDLPMILLDIEETYDVQVSYAYATSESLTIGRLIRSVAHSVEAKKIARAQPVVRRPKRSWVSTGAER